MSYDGQEFSLRANVFTVTGNATGPFVIGSSVTFVGSTQVGNTSEPFTSVLSVAEQIEAVPLQLRFSYRLANLTDGQGFLMRNPDGSFYKSDSFCVKWNATFQFADVRTDIKVNATATNPSLVNLNSSGDGREGQFCYLISASASYQQYKLPLDFHALAPLGTSIAHGSSAVPFAVVRYSPNFTAFTYMRYNGLGSSSYDRPFVTLIRYGGNHPGYSYEGDANTKPFGALNATGQRAMINNFTFSVEGWSLSYSDSNSPPLTFLDSGPVPLALQSPNASSFVITWSHRVAKYYFAVDGSQFRHYLPLGIEYYNVTEHAYSRNFAGGDRSLFNTTYLYEPVFYNGYLVFKAYDQNSQPDPDVTLAVSAHSPNPLNQYLLQRITSVFGDGGGVIRAFKQDLFDAYDSTQSLRPIRSGHGVWVFLVNQTNLAIAGSAAPVFTITAVGHGHTFAYNVPDSFSSFLLSRVDFTSLPFPSITAYQLGSLTSLPLTFNLSGGSQFVTWKGSIENSTTFLPLLPEPGGLTDIYPFIYGRNTTISINMAGGGITATTQNKGWSYFTTLAAGTQSGGVRAVWILDDRGKLLHNATLLPNSAAPSPPGYVGSTTFAWSPDHNGTALIGVTNAEGVSSMVTVVEVSLPLSPIPDFMAFLWLLLGSLSASLVLGRTISRKRPMGTMRTESAFSK